MSATTEDTTATPPPSPGPRPATVPQAVTPAGNDHIPVTRIDGGTSWSWHDVQELWRFRELFYYLTLRDIKLRYKQTILGIGWSVFQPLATIIVFVVFIGILGKAADGVEGSYTLFVMAGVIPWSFFASAVQNSGNSLINNERLVTKTYFPRLALPAANVFAAMFDFSLTLSLFGLTVLGFALTGYPIVVTANLLLAPVVVFFLAMFALGMGVWLSALIAAQRDFRFLITFGIQLWMFATPCIYLPPSSLSDKAKLWIQFNPVYGLITNFRAAVLGGPIDWPALGIAVVLSSITFLLGLIYFRRVDRTLADTI